MPRLERLEQLLRTRPFRWSIAYLAAVLVLTGSVVLFLTWRLNGLLIAQVRATIESELGGLLEQYRLGGDELLARAIAARSRAGAGGL